ncbi:MAG: hypothetical protein K5924_07240 [Chloroflexi bacterium]|nr:hypothetical protein [Chloroflexota bacterium]
MKLSEWLDEYRAFPTEGHIRPRVDTEDDWEEPELLVPEDRVPDRSPRWLRRAERVGYGRPTHI